MKRCMFVDASSVVRKVAKRILGSPDLVFIDAETAGQALDMCEAGMPELIVIDTALPDMNAEELIRRIRRMEAPIKPQIAISLIEVDIGAIMRAKRAGANGYILKPFNRPQLLDRFRALDVAA